MKVFEMPSPFAPGAVVVGTSSMTKGRNGKVTATRDDGTVIVRMWGDIESLSWHWSHFALVDPATGETVNPLCTRPTVPTK